MNDEYFDHNVNETYNYILSHIGLLVPSSTYAKSNLCHCVFIWLNIITMYYWNAELAGRKASYCLLIQALYKTSATVSRRRTSHTERELFQGAYQNKCIDYNKCMKCLSMCSILLLYYVYILYINCLNMNVV